MNEAGYTEDNRSSPLRDKSFYPAMVKDTGQAILVMSLFFSVLSAFSSAFVLGPEFICHKRGRASYLDYLCFDRDATRVERREYSNGDFEDVYYLNEKWGRTSWSRVHRDIKKIRYYSGRRGGFLEDFEPEIVSGRGVDGRMEK